MPRIENPQARKSRFINWIKRGVDQGCAHNRPIKPKHSTWDSFTLAYGRLPYRNHLDLTQIYSSESRKSYVDHISTTIKQLPCERTVQLRWQVSKEVPAFSLDFLYVYLSRFGAVTAIYQLANNAALVTFKNVQSTRLVLSTQEIGFPYGRLYIKHWNPTKLDADYYRVIKHVGKAAETKFRFHSLMDKDDRLSIFCQNRMCCRNICDSSMRYGNTLKRLFNREIQVQEFSRRSLPPKKSTIVTIVGQEDYTAAIRKLGTLIVVDFFATWCGPCKRISPLLDELVSKLSNVLVAKVNVDECMEIAEEEDVKSLPTFVFYRDGVKLDTLVGADEERLIELFTAYSQ